MSFDESLNKVAQKGPTDIVFVFWWVLFLFMCFALSHKKKTGHVGMDGPNVNKPFLFRSQQIYSREQ